ncbi:hypothetical protein O6H91_Y313300 [Diphasiastrum complanatum]|nr:hypothetical protein O6H91_Y313200 [Diphasiastrum complanatum]KAJ7299058.1 hypothetical protein O6H91_Y313200 [Diphasiastrum complanatum]KAJ7299059.1 hypothetical protein O6H91_Y313300 [Diphasiastrum complanatum]
MGSISKDELHTGSQQLINNVWGDMPEEQFYASQGVINSKEFFSTANGRIFTQSFLPRSHELKGIVCLNHGYSSHTGWLVQFTAISFAQWGYAAFAADFLGHGRSDGLPCYIPNINKLAETSLSYFKSIRDSKEYKGKPAFLYGESMGGAVALLMHLKDPEGWDGVILAAPMITVPETRNPSWLHFTACRMMLGLADTLPIPSRSSNSDLQDYRDEERAKLRAMDTLRYIGQVRFGSYRELLWLMDHLQKNMDKITLPILTLHGTGDNVTDPGGSKMLVDKAKSKDKTAKFYEGSHHSLVQGEPEETRKTILADIKEWLDQQVQKSSKL